MASTILFIGLLIFVAHLLSGLFEKTTVPDVLLLMVIGIIIGPIAGIVRPEDFGKVGPLITTIALIVILFASGIDLRFSSIRKAIGFSFIITFLNFFATGGVLTILFRLLTGCSWVVALMTGSIIGGISSAVVLPIIRTIKLSEKAHTILFFESAMSDVLCIVFTFGFLKAYELGGLNITGIAQKVLLSLGLASIIGLVSAFFWSFLLRIIRRVPDNIFTTLAYIFVIYGITELLGYSGAISALAFGITLANIRKFEYKNFKPAERLQLSEFTTVEKGFFSEVVFLLKIFFFVYLGISIKISDFNVMLVGFLFTIAILFARLIVIFVFAPRSLSPRDASIMSAMIPKGLAAAVLASIPLQMGVEFSDVILDIVYSVILWSIIACSILIPFIEKVRLGGVYKKIFSHFKGVSVSDDDNIGINV
ncbi:MAG: sodium:proton exchanger [Candidatus Coatesbacteria bacterium]|nr:MAG: sodium:proton exchanger [Candidatus Coatesbacteria bacterium]